jgi:hypothetical protein
MPEANRRGLDQVLRFMVTSGGEPVDPSDLGVRVKILGPGELDAIRVAPCWSSLTMDDGRILAVSLVGGAEGHEGACDELVMPLGVHAMDEAEDPEWCADARDLRGRILTLLEGLPKTSWLEMAVGGNGTAKFAIDYGEARLTMAIGRDPNA